MLRVIVKIFCSDDFFRRDSLFYPQFERFQEVVIRIDDGSVTDAVSKCVRTNPAVAMSHSWCHEDAIEIVGVTHFAGDPLIIINAVLRRDGGVSPTGILNQFSAVTLKLPEVGIC